MKTFNDIMNNKNSSIEEGYRRKGAGLIFASKSRAHGKKAEQYFKKAIGYIDNETTNMDDEERLTKLMLAIGELSKGLIEIRHQNGNITALALTSLTINEKANKRID